MAQSYQQQNISVFNKDLEAYTKKVELKIVSVLGEVANDVVAFIEGSGIIPVATANLQDSTGVGVYYNGQLVKYKPVQRAIVGKAGTVIYPKGIAEESKDYWGTNELDDALDLAITTFNKNIWVVAFSTMPYAALVEARRNFFEEGVAKDLADQVIAGFSKMKNVKA